MLAWEADLVDRAATALRAFAVPTAAGPDAAMEIGPARETAPLPARETAPLPAAREPGREPPVVLELTPLLTHTAVCSATV